MESQGELLGEFSKSDMKILKGIAILFMMMLHLFCNKNVNGLYETFPMIGDVPSIYYLALFGDACVPIYCFASGYGLFVTLCRNQTQGANTKRNFMRIFKLMVNYWIVMILFLIVGIVVGNNEFLPINLGKLILNFFMLSSSYNGAWWFVQTYIILVLLSPLVVTLTKKYNSIIVLLVSGVIYLISYVQRIKHVVNFADSALIDAIVTDIVLIGTSLLPFIVGSIFAKEKIYSRLKNKLSNIAFKNTLCLIGIWALIVVHSVYQSLIIAPLTAIPFICLFTLMEKGQLIQKALNFFGDHSTNIWLSHMFFYLILFPKLTFAPKYPILIFIWLLILCLFSSYIINLIYNPIIRYIDKISSVSRYNNMVEVNGEMKNI
jgi:fucose 4-O-acetylase-like acetyltransferase